jgi:hypothetical protein
MQGTDASVLVPQDQAWRQLMTWRAASSGVVSRG